jgi:hypothetical protein
VQTVVPGTFTINRVMGDLWDREAVWEAVRIEAQPLPMRDVLCSERGGFFDVLA